MSGARLIRPIALALVLVGGSVEAGDQPTATEPVSGSFDHEPSQTGSAPTLGEAGLKASQAEAASGEGREGEHASLNLQTLALQLLNFGALLFILIWFGGRALSKFLRSRHAQLKADIDGAASRRAQAEQQFREQESRLANLEKELAALRAEVQQFAERERARLLQGAEDKARRIQEETRFELDQQVKEAEQRLRAEVASTAIKVADELLRRSVNSEDERRLAQDFAAGAQTPAGTVR